MTMRVRSMALLLFMCLALPAGGRSPAQAAPGAASRYAKLHVTRVKGPALEDSNATQFIAADKKGHPLVLQGDTLEVSGLGSDERFDRRMGKLACSRSADSATLYAAAMDPDDFSTWAVSSASEVALCDFAKEQRPPGLVGWVISSLSYSRSGPLVAVTSLGPPPDGTNYFSGTEPRVFGLANDRWQPVVLVPVRERKRDRPADRLTILAELRAHPMEALAEGKAESDALICSTTPKDEIWLASWNSYRLQRVSPSEKPQKADREIVVGRGEVEWPQLTQKEQDREAQDRKAQGVEAIPSTVGGVGPRGVVRALLCKREIYLVVATEDGLALDRFDPAQNVLERVMLDGMTVSSSGPMTAAFAGDEIWLGGRFAADGLWRISPEDLMAARWKPVKDVKIDGKRLS